jgi:aspartokinase
MITVPEVTEKIIKRSAFLEEAMAMDIINLSSLARIIKPDIQKELFKDIKDGAIVMALKRIQPKLKVKTKLSTDLYKQLEDLAIKSNLCSFTFANSRTINDSIDKIISKLRSNKNQFITITQGMFESSIILSQKYIETVEQIFSEETVVNKSFDLASITIRLASDNVNSPGVYYKILKSIAWNNLNIIDIVSTANELSLLFDDKDIELAFTIIKRLMVTK